MNKGVFSINKSAKLVFFGILLTYNLIFSQNSKHILVLGDSNGALNYGWVSQLQKMMPNNKLYNTSIPGNTIGFDNLEKFELNTLKNLNNYLQSAQDSLGRLDYVLIMLGTNDAKYIFKDRQDEVIPNMEKLISQINNFDFKYEGKPKIIIMSPPPYGKNNKLEKKYIDGGKRVKRLAKNLNKLAKDYNCGFVNVYKGLKHVFNNYSKDGIHLDELGQKAIASLVLKTF